jgi:anaerobic selenocysteine-containing dehydrogenase
MVSRRDFLKLGAAAAAGAPMFAGGIALAKETGLTATGGEDYSYLSGAEREPIPTTCALCPSRCPAIGFVERGYVLKIEGQPSSIRTRGLLCAKGQAGTNHVYDPDRILYPLRRAGRRGAGKWTRITWDQALTELAGRLKKLRDDGIPEKFMIQHGTLSASADRLINKVFLPNFGTGTVSGNACPGQGTRRAAFELTWGGIYDSWDFERTRYILNFGSNVFEADTNHVALACRLAPALADRRIKMTTFDVRFSNTASKSDTWIQIKPGTDLAVVLAMCHVVMSEGLYRGQGEAFLKFCKATGDQNVPTSVKVAALKSHLKPFSPEWAEKISGVSAGRIHDIAVEFATIKPACVISSRGAVSHYNGVETERAIQMLAAITGNIENPGGRCMGVRATWAYPSPENKPQTKALDILSGFDGAAALPTHGVDSQVLKLIKDGRAGRPEVYLCYGQNPVFSQAEVRENIDILKDEALIPFSVSVTPFYDETAALADLILPDATYLERYDFDEGISPDQVAEYAIGQPVITPLGEARDFKDVCCDLAERMGFPLGFKSGEEFVKMACRLTPAVKKKAGGFGKMKKKGVWHDPEAKPTYFSYRRRIAATEALKDGVIFDEATGVYWDWKLSGAATESEAWNKGYARTPNAYRGYIGQLIGDDRRRPSNGRMDREVFVGFRPDKINKSGFFELYSESLRDKGYSPLPTYVSIPEHEVLEARQLILTTFRVNVQTLAGTQNCRWLSEIHHASPAWINSATADAAGVGDGDTIRLVSGIGEIVATAKVTENVAPGVVAVSSHGGRWEFGRYASGKMVPFGVDDSPHEQHIWWKPNPKHKHPNWIIPVSSEPINGQQRWMDTVVTLVKT